jgi:hypothetical protein
VKSANIQNLKPEDFLQGLQIKGQDKVILKEIRFGDELKIPVEQLSSNGLELHLQPYDFFVYDVS